MDQWENDFLNFENELLLTRKKLNDLIYEYQNREKNPPSNAIYQDKLHYLEVELQYINNQMQLLKRAQSDGSKADVQTSAPVKNMAVQNVQTSVMQNPVMPAPVTQNSVMQNPMAQNPMPQDPVAQNPVLQNPGLNQQPRNPQRAANLYPAGPYVNTPTNIAAAKKKTNHTGL